MRGVCPTAAIACPQPPPSIPPLISGISLSPPPTGVCSGLGTYIPEPPPLQLYETGVCTGMGTYILGAGNKSAFSQTYVGGGLTSSEPTPQAGDECCACGGGETSPLLSRYKCLDPPLSVQVSRPGCDSDACKRALPLNPQPWTGMPRLAYTEVLCREVSVAEDLSPRIMISTQVRVHLVSVEAAMYIFTCGSVKGLGSKHVDCPPLHRLHTDSGTHYAGPSHGPPLHNPHAAGLDQDIVHDPGAAAAVPPSLPLHAGPWPGGCARVTATGEPLPETLDPVRTSRRD